MTALIALIQGTGLQTTSSGMWDRMFEAVSASVIYSLLGVVIFAVSFMMLVRVIPFSVRREIEEDQNVALGVILGSVIIGISIIVAAAIVG